MLRGVFGKDGGRVLAPYADASLARRANAWVSILVIGFCLVYGMVFTALGQQAAALLPAPLLALSLLVVWALPDTSARVDQLPAALVFVFVVSLVLWPNYLAIALPGLPWITLVRLTGFPLVLTLLVCVSISPAYRSSTAAALESAPGVWRLLLAFSALAALSVAWSADPAETLQHVILGQVFWTGVFFVSVNAFLSPGRAGRMVGLLWAMAIIVGLIAIQESRVKAVLWVGRIPSFLRIQDPSVARSLAGNFRESGAYRAQATFTTPLGLGEYLALTLPFVLHMAATAKKLVVRAAAAASCLLILIAAALSGARLGLIGSLVGALLYVFVWGLMKWRNNRRDLLGVATVLAYPAIFTGAITASFFVGRIRNLVWGDGSQNSSNQARIDQWIMGMPKIFDRPWGYGLGMGAVTLNYRPYGVLTIDSYYLLMLLEVGVVGFLLYYGMLLSAIGYGASALWKRRGLAGETGLIAPATIALCAFVVEKAVFSEQDNHPLAFMLMGMVAALAYRARQEAKDPSQLRMTSEPR
jgi:hypothetical protein